jgi:hypothetical protein
VIDRSPSLFFSHHGSAIYDAGRRPRPDARAAFPDPTHLDVNEARATTMTSHKQTMEFFRSLLTRSLAPRRRGE